MILSKRRFGVAVLASMFLVACGGGGGDGTEPTGEAPITPDSPGKIAGLGSFGGTPQGPEFQLPAGIKLASSLTGLYVGPSGDSVGQISLSTSTTAALPAATTDRLAAARRAGLGTIKVNAVVPDRQDLARLPELARFCLDHGYQLRVIEQMPLDADHRWNRTQMVTADDILDALRSEFTLVDDDRPRGSAPADTWMVPGHHTPGGEPARIGVIASITRPFCGDCEGGMFGFFLLPELPQNYAQVLKTDGVRFNQLFHGLLDRGVYIAPALYEAGFVSAAHTEQDIADTVAIARDVFKSLTK